MATRLATTGLVTTRLAAVLAGLAVPVAILLGERLLGPAGALGLVGGGVAIGWVYVPRFWRTLVRGALAGGLAGMLVLGPGYRLAMRAVAILDASVTPEFTLEGTMFLVLGIGGVFGAVATAGTTVLATTFTAPRTVAVTLLTAVAVGLLFLDSATLQELTDLGLGPWLNVPLFLGVTIGWAWLADRWARPSLDTGPSRHVPGLRAMMASEQAR